MALKLGIQALRSCLRLPRKYDLHILSNTKVNVAKDHGENFMKVRPPLARHLLRNRLYLILTKITRQIKQLPNVVHDFLLALV